MDRRYDWDRSKANLKKRLALKVREQTGSQQKKAKSYDPDMLSVSLLATANAGGRSHYYICMCYTCTTVMASGFHL